jgi:excisionase family DNA binding protein
MHRRLQFGMRENPASDRRHGSRVAVDSKGPARDTEEKGSAQSSPTALNENVGRMSSDAAEYAATGGEKTENGQLLSVHDIAALLQVPVSWVYGHTRDRCPDRIPGFRLGKYWRFDEADVLAWIQRRRLGMRRNSCVSEYNGTR